MDDLDIRDLTEFRSWSTTFDPPIDDPTFFLSNHLSITSALLLTDLMFPACVLVRGCVIRKEIYDPENFERWWRETGGATEVIENVLNHLHLWDLLEPNEDAEYRALEVLAPRIAQTWKSHVQSQFPDRVICTEVNDDYGPTVTMWTA
ncbi:MAG: hypothetical protein SOH99_15600 [Acidipropionibacterium acidipropionici]|jgi:hypothetical protein|uniref:hypothetical protein n=1 Tax=Acidipropionibacterium acidipropionici TaxID=1748 RepID=UPI002F35F4BB